MNLNLHFVDWKDYPLEIFFNHAMARIAERHQLRHVWIEGVEVAKDGGLAPG